VSFFESLPFALIIFGIVLAYVVLKIYLLFGGMQTFALNPLRHCFNGIRLHEAPEPGDVRVVYHTYRGLLMWVDQEEHRVLAPVEDAERLLRRFLRYNLTWGMLSKAFIFIPFLAVGNYYAQRRSIRVQSSRGGAPFN
jgi:hypothetical protein